MLQALFAVPVLVTNLGLSDDARFLLRERALNAYRVNNVNLKPWSRSTRESLVNQEPVFKDLFASVICVAETALVFVLPLLQDASWFSLMAILCPRTLSLQCCLLSTGLIPPLHLTTLGVITTDHLCFKAQ